MLFLYFLLVNVVFSKPQFQSSIIELPVKPSQSFLFNVSDLLKDPTQFTGAKFELSNFPSFVKNDDKKIFGTAPEDISFSVAFDVTVSKENESDKALVRLVSQPQWLQTPFNLGVQKVSEKFELDLMNPAFIKFPKDAIPQFAISNQPNWLTLAQGKLSGTPTLSDVGEYKDVKITVSTQAGVVSEAVVSAFGRVKKDTELPSWVQTQLPDAFEDQLYQVKLHSNTYVRNPEGLSLKFRKVNQLDQSWLYLSESGELAGLPLASQVGMITLDVVMETQIEGVLRAIPASLKLSVKHVNHSPQWNIDPIKGPSAKVNLLYEQNLKSSFTDKDQGDTHLCEIVSGPSWLKMDLATCKIYGAAQLSDVGENTWKVLVKDQNQASSITTFIVSVEKPNMPPKWVSSVIELKEAPEDSSYAIDLRSFVSDSDNDTLKFTLLNRNATSSWLKLTEAGLLWGSPEMAHVGLSEISVMVSDMISTPNDTATLRIMVKHTNHAPRWVLNPVQLTHPEDSEFKKDLREYVTDSDLSLGDTLKFIAISLPPWLTLLPNGLLFGTPNHGHEGKNEVAIRVQDSQGVPAAQDGKVVIEITHVNHSPRWRTMTALEAFENKNYELNLSDFAEDIDPNDTLSFAKVVGPTWASVDSNGLLHGIPRRADIGINIFKLRAMDKAGAISENEIKVKVNKVNQPPTWLQDPIKLPLAKEDEMFQFNIKNLAADSDIEDILTFEKMSGPSWIKVESDGSVSGIPGAVDVGEFTAIFLATDGRLGTEVAVTGMVFHTNHAPQWMDNELQFVVNERDVVAFNLSESKYVSDKDKDALRFKALSQTPDFIKVSSNGMLILTPKHENLGIYQVKVEVSDGTLTDEALAKISVVRDPQKPIWKENPLVFTGKALKPFEGNISLKATDPDGVSLKFSKVSGVEWLKVSEGGILSGTPTASDVGPNKFTLRASNDALYADVELIVGISEPNHSPLWTATLIKLPAAMTLVPYSYEISSSASDPDRDALLFSKVSGPEWVRVTLDGKISGIPQAIDANQTFGIVVRVSDVEGLSSDSTFEINVLKQNTAPRWVSDPLSLPNIMQGVLFSLDLKTKVSDTDNDALKFSLLSAPSWMSVSQEGMLTGTPDRIGDFSVVMNVTDGQNSTSATGQGKIVEKNIAPLWVSQPVLLPDARVEQAYAHSLSKYVTDSDLDAITFEKISGPAWISITKAGVVIGKPSLSDKAVTLITVRAQDARGLYTDGKVSVAVKSTENVPPKWLKNPLDLGSIKVGENFIFDLSLHATDADADTLIFDMLSAPSWLKISSDGKLSGIPSSVDMGQLSIQFEVKDSHSKVLTEAKGVVKNQTNSPPRWLSSPTSLGNIEQGKSIDLSLKSYVSDPDGDVLYFKWISGPSWLRLDEDRMEGLASSSQLGEFEVQVEVTDGVVSSTNKFSGKIITYQNHAPYWTSDKMDLGWVRPNTKYEIELSEFVKDSDSDLLNFRLKSAPVFLTLKGSLLEFYARPSDKGDFVAIIEVTDGLATAEVGLMGKVLGTTNMEPPAWIEDPIQLTIKESQKIYINLMEKINDPNEPKQALAFSLEEPANGLTLNKGVLEINTALMNLGTYRLFVKASNESGLSSQSHLNISIVSSYSHHENYVLDTPLAGAKSESLWLIDNSRNSERVVSNLKKNISSYYAQWIQKPVSNFSVILSSDLQKWNGVPTDGLNSRLTLNWQNLESWGKDFKYRVDRIFSNSLYNTPLVSLIKFSEKIKSYYYENFFSNTVPLDVIVVSEQPDAYKKFMDISHQEWIERLRALSKKHEKPIRFHFLSCSMTSDVYTAIQSVFKGKNIQDCTKNWTPDLKKMAEESYARSVMFSNKKIMLSQRPESSVKLSINGTSLDESLWSIEEQNGKSYLKFNWYLIDEQHLLLGNEKITLQY